MNTNSIWLFHGINGRFASGAFTEIELAEEWISAHKLTGVLTAYPTNVGVYHWGVKSGSFKPRKEEHYSAEFISKFTTAGQEHFHYENGIRG